jgi:hypothetical protein
MGLYYNAVQNDRTFPRIIKWHNEQLSKTATLPILGITQAAMLCPIHAQRGSPETTQTCIRSEISQSGLFNAIHSTRQTAEEGRWILVIRNKIHTDAAIKFFDLMMKAIYASDKPQIPTNERLEMTPIPHIE